MRRHESVLSDSERVRLLIVCVRVHLECAQRRRELMELTGQDTAIADATIRELSLLVGDLESAAVNV